MRRSGWSRFDAFPSLKSPGSREWPAWLSFVSFGVRIGIRATDPALLERLSPHFPPGSQVTDVPAFDGFYSVSVAPPDQTGEGDPVYVLSAGGETLAQSADLQELCTVFEASIDRFVSLAARRWLFVHAGVVEWGGRALIIPGRSMSGKSSLVAALVRAGAAYYSDEFAVFDPEGGVHPYPRPLSLRGRGGAPPRKCPAEELGGRVGQHAIPADHVVAAEYHHDAEWKPRLLSAGETLLALLDNTVAVRRQPEFALPILRRVAAGATGIQGRRGEAAIVAGELMGERSSASASGIKKSEQHSAERAQASGSTLALG